MDILEDNVARPKTKKRKNKHTTALALANKPDSTIRNLRSQLTKGREYLLCYKNLTLNPKPRTRKEALKRPDIEQ